MLLDRLNPTQRDAVESTEGPLLILAGADDPIIPLVNARIMARLLPDATIVGEEAAHADADPAALVGH